MISNQVRKLLLVLLFVTIPTFASGQLGVPLEEGIVTIGRKITGTMIQANKTKIAIMSFVDSRGKTNVFCDYIAESLTTELFESTKFEVYERALLDQVLKEHKLGETGALLPETVKTIGKLTGVQAIVTGTAVEMAEGVGVNVRLISTESGQVFSAARVVINKDVNVGSMLESSGNSDPTYGGINEENKTVSDSSVLRSFELLVPGRYEVESAHFHADRYGFDVSRNSRYSKDHPHNLEIRSVEITGIELRLHMYLANEFPYSYTHPTFIYLNDSLGKNYPLLRGDGLQRGTNDPLMNALGRGSPEAYQLRPGSFQFIFSRPTGSLSGLNLYIGDDRVEFSILKVIGR